MTPEEKKEKIAYHFEQILGVLGLDLEDPSLSKTPQRVAKMYVDEIFSGLDPQTYPEITFHEESVHKEVVLVKNIALISFCEHHLVPMMGVAHVAYQPSSGVLGLSKIHRIIRFLARRPQLQERLTREIADKMEQELQTEDVAVAVELKHLCVLARGVEDHGSEVETHILRGRFETDPGMRSEFFLRIGQEEKSAAGTGCA